jgi:hypothetical protein
MHVPFARRYTDRDENVDVLTTCTEHVIGNGVLGQKASISHSRRMRRYVFIFALRRWRLLVREVMSAQLRQVRRIDRPS